MIAVPPPMYDAIQNSLKNYGATCYSYIAYQPPCLFIGDINTLPNITFHYKDQKIHIPPSVYVNYSTTAKVLKEIKLNFKMVSPLKYKRHLWRIWIQYRCGLFNP